MSSAAQTDASAVPAAAPVQAAAAPSQPAPPPAQPVPTASNDLQPPAPTPTPSANAQQAAAALTLASGQAQGPISLSATAGPAVRLGAGTQTLPGAASKTLTVKAASASDMATATSAIADAAADASAPSAAVPTVDPLADKASDGASDGNGGAAAQNAPEQTGQPAAPTAMAAPVVAFQPVQHATPAGLGQTVARLSADIVRGVQSKSSHFEVGLDPAGLGRVDVKVRIGADGAMTASLKFDNPQSAEALKARSGELRAALEQAGFSLEGSGLSFTSGDSGRQAENGGGNLFRAGAAFAAAAEAADPSLVAIHAGQTASGGLDMRI